MRIRRVQPVTLLLLLGLAACSGTPESRYYVLGRSAEPFPSAPPANARTVLVDPVTVAAYADRAQLVTRLDANRVRFEEFEAWAEPVGSLITAALVDELARRFGADQVQATGGAMDLVPDARVTVDVLRLDTDPAGQVVLDARWTVTGGPDRMRVATGRERITEQVSGTPPTYPERIAAVARALAVLGTRIGDRIATLPRTRR